jgi:small subunit ribosomal protein S17
MADETETQAAADAPVEAVAPAPTPAAEPVEKLHPKVARKRARSAHDGSKPAPARTAEERDAERRAVRKAAASARARRRQQERAKHVPSGKPGTEKAAHGEGGKQIVQGIVTSAKPDKTITVRLDVARRHRKYHKIVRSSTKIHAHDETNDAGEGDVVRVIESRPLSALKRWSLVEVVERAR